MDPATGDVVYALPDKLGGVFNYCANLLAHRRGPMRYRAVVTHRLGDTDVRSSEPLPVDSQAKIEYSATDNLYTTLRRVRRALDGRGALVANDWIELATAAAYPVDRTIFSICHMDSPYYYDLAVRHEPEIDVYLTYTKFLRDKLIALLPHRQDTIVLRRYGVEIGGRRTPAPGPLRLLYSGRLDARKGVFDLPVIDAALSRSGVDVVWTLQGSGPDGDQLRRVWQNPKVQYRGRRSMPEVIAEYLHQDVLVMPSRHEGLPVALLEAGAAGVVPVVSDLPTGIPEIVEQGVTGYRFPIGDVGQFAAAIATLARDRARLEAMSTAMRDVIAREWNITDNAPGYESLFDRWASLRLPRMRRGRHIAHYANRLDRPWIPNGVVRSVRRVTGYVRHRRNR